MYYGSSTFTDHEDSFCAMLKPISHINLLWCLAFATPRERRCLINCDEFGKSSVTAYRPSHCYNAFDAGSDSIDSDHLVVEGFDVDFEFDEGATFSGTKSREHCLRSENVLGDATEGSIMYLREINQGIIDGQFCKTNHQW